MFRYPIPTPILPTLHTFSVTKTPILATPTYTSVTGIVTRTQTQMFPTWEFRLKYSGLRTETQNIEKFAQWSPQHEYEQIIGVFLACKGRYGRFFFRDLSDYRRVGQHVGTGDGVVYAYRIIRTLGLGDKTLYEPVGGVDLREPFTVWWNDVEIDTGFSVSEDLQSLVFNTPPPPGMVIKTDFCFFYYCRFIEDVEDFEEFVRNVHSVGEFAFVSTKDRDRYLP